MGEILKTLREPTYRGRLDWYLKALEVNKWEDNTTIIMYVSRNWNKYKWNLLSI